MLTNDNPLAFFIVIVMFFILLMSSNDVFPNVVLPLVGVHLMVTKENYNIFYFSKQKDCLSNVKKLNSLGNTGSLSRTYILSDGCFLGDEMEDKKDE